MLCRINVLYYCCLMHQVNRQAIVRHNAQEMFTLVNDIKRYPEFLKWCHDSHLLEESKNSMTAGLTVSLAGFKQKFTTKNDLFYEEDHRYRIQLSLINGPFENLNGYWLFSPLNNQASKIELYLEFNFKSGILNNAFKKGFGMIAQQLVSDFVKRAAHVYS